MYLIFWDEIAIETLLAESEFILKKWNYKEVQKFEKMVSERLEKLALNPFVGLYDDELNVYKFVISKQTSLYYGLEENSKSIYLYVFWNNQRKPKELMKILER
ncbi:hypothetical protein BWK60_06890 [Flavobacterium covae]|uniref:hypothetical protein n=1 Tax=Flavobacterium covae TaxID=2906076 RepID=UPI000B4CE6F6|nr:hypothetical protein [Flavobacterium covae]OWP86823.1 hypothetical protein BWK60_06890 [Flavobacterium covae]